MSYSRIRRDASSSSDYRDAAKVGNIASPYMTPQRQRDAVMYAVPGLPVKSYFTHLPVVRSNLIANFRKMPTPRDRRLLVVMLVIATMIIIIIIRDDIREKIISITIRFYSHG